MEPLLERKPVGRPRKAQNRVVVSHEEFVRVWCAQETFLEIARTLNLSETHLNRLAKMYRKAGAMLPFRGRRAKKKPINSDALNVIIEQMDPQGFSEAKAKRSGMEKVSEPSVV